jgi:hypothetical protein
MRNALIVFLTVLWVGIVFHLGLFWGDRRARAECRDLATRVIFFYEPDFRAVTTAVRWVCDPGPLTLAYPTRPSR